MDDLGLTPTERRMYDLLSDGKPHSIKELLGCLWDELSGTGSVAVHLCRLRKKLRPKGKDVRAITQGRTYWYVFTSADPAWFGPVP